MKISILSLFPEYFDSPLSCSMLKRAIQANIIDVNQVNIRDFAKDKHKTVDDRPYGGGPGMVLKPEPVVEAVKSVRTKQSKVVLLSPQGQTLTAKKCRELSECPDLVIVCGHYEGIDERVNDMVIDEEISIGDYVLTSGCPAALVLVDSIVRFIPGVLGHEDAANMDSFEEGRFDAPCYTRPEIYQDRRVPDVLLKGNHKEIAKWRELVARKKTAQVRPELQMTEKMS